jgi:valyl-tRNA synthetase
MTELEKAYDHSKVEEKIYKMWEASGFFNPDKLPGKRKEPYTIIMPPPNANAPMHLGHALFVTIEDILIRYKRMQGYKALWQPGTDHAGFETQVVFEKKLEKEGRSRFKMQREEFYKEVWDFVQANKHITENGLRRLGASCDWDRNIFTLDPKIIKIVYGTFKKMYGDGLMYRGLRLGNWCFKHQTALSDLETKYEERVEPYYYLKYGPFIISTSRPETKFGDKYVVMHPDDKRYKQYNHGDKINLEWINGPITATIIKDKAVDMGFGTGIMTITPWHDPVDFELAERLKLDKEQIIDMRGKLLPIAGEFAGMKILEARPKIIEKLAAKGLLDHIDEKYKHNVQMCYKCGTLIEPQIIPQWFVAMTKELPDGRPSLRDMAIKAIENKEVEIVTEKFEKIFMHWMKNLRDWPVSRQIWWGIPIPVKYCADCKEIVIDTEDSIKTCPKCQSKNLEKDPDTFDTWFSSGQWPYATLMANDVKYGTKDFENYFPTQVMETGWDILFFWVARMVMMSYYRTGKPPFEKVYLHGLVRDKDRQKMSKSKGNVIDPLGVIDTYGCDALRFALIFSTSAGNDIPLAEDKIKGMKHFANKLWNIARYILANIDNSSLQTTSYQLPAITDADKNILAKLDAAIKNVTEHLENFRLHEAAQEIYQFTWYEFADIYIEASKKQLADKNLKASTLSTLHYSLTTILKLLHPFMPFVTEEIWSKLNQKELLIISNWPKL